MQSLIEIRTLIFVITLILVCRGAIMAYVWVIGRQYGPVRYWSIGSAMIAAGAFLIGLRDIISPIASIFVAQALLMWGWLATDAGIALAAGFRPLWRQGAAAALAGLAGVFWYLFVEPDFSIRTLMTGVPQVLFDAYAAFACLRSRQHRQAMTLRILGGALIVLAASNGLKIGFIAQNDVHNIFSPSWQIGQFYLVSVIFTVISTVLFVLLAMQRVQEQLDEEIAEHLETEKNLNSALLKAEQFRTALDHVPAYVYMKDVDSRYLYANAPTLQLFGCKTVEELVGADDDRFFPAKVAEHLRAIDRNVFAGASTTEEIVVPTGSVDHRVYLEVKTPLYDGPDQRRVIGLCGISIDITLLKDHEKELEKQVHTRTCELAAARDLAESASRAKSMLLANLSHELRTPMNHIMGINSLIAHQVKSQEGQHLLEIERKSANHLLKLINKLLDTVRIESQQFELKTIDFNLEDLLDYVERKSKDDLAARETVLKREVQARLPARIHGDFERLALILSELVGNAIKFSNGEPVILRVSQSHATQALVRLRFEVTDEGIGMPEEMHGSLFAFFSQGDGSSTRRYGGTGIGLALCKRIVTLMAGEIGFTSLAGHGSTFWVDLPLTLGQAEGISDDMASGDLDAAREQFDELLALLETADAAAMVLWKRIAPQFGHLLGDSRHAFEAALTSYDFEEAMKLLEAALP